MLSVDGEGTDLADAVVQGGLVEVFEGFEVDAFGDVDRGHLVTDQFKLN